jgi:alkylation response protein AidB-like acyl-CoA dehydrogenase
VTLPPDALLAQDIGTALTAAVEEATLALAAQLLGLSGTALDMTADYLRTRVQFGQSLASFQVLQHRMVDLSIERRLAASTLRNAARVLADGDAAAYARAVSMAKARCSQAAVAIAKDAVQLHGAIGFTDEADIGLHLRVALRLAALHGGAAAHRSRFARLRPADADDE